MTPDIPVSVLITTRNEERNLPRCLAALERFAEVIVIDSYSSDRTVDVAKSFGAKVVSFLWNGQYPKKRQWALDTLALMHDWVFFVDADEEVTPALCDEIAALDFTAAGYFIKGFDVVEGRTLRYGLKNNKLCLIDRRKIHFPVVDDLDIPGMGEIEGHYQPVLKNQGRIECLSGIIRHHVITDPDRYEARHAGYALWRKGMERKKAYPKDPLVWRRAFKAIFANLPARAALFFLYYYVVRLGFLEYPRNAKIFRQKLRYYTAKS